MIYEETFFYLVCDTRLPDGRLGPDMEVTLDVTLDISPCQHDDDDWDVTVVGERFEIVECKNLDTGELYFGPGFCPYAWRGSPAEVWAREHYCGYLAPVPWLRARILREWHEILERRHPAAWSEEGCRG